MIRDRDLSSGSDDATEITAFKPDRITVGYSSTGEQLLVLLQNNYYGWCAEIDHSAVPVMTANMSFISVVAPAGNHDVVFSYRPAGIIAGFWISVGMIIVQLTGLTVMIFFIKHR
jgi:uncharacterized membrane protein YfhO